MPMMTLSGMTMAGLNHGTITMIVGLALLYVLKTKKKLARPDPDALDDVEDITPMLTSPRSAPHPLPLSKRRSSRSYCAQAAAAYGLGDGDPQTLRPRHGCG